MVYKLPPLVKESIHTLPIFLSQPCTKSQITRSRVLFIEHGSPVMRWIGQPAHNILGFLGLLWTHKHNLQGQVLSEFMGDFPGVPAEERIMHHYEQVKIASRMWLPIGMGAKTNHHRRAKALCRPVHCSRNLFTDCNSFDLSHSVSPNGFLLQEPAVEQPLW
jgi:hypothetical protein